MNNTYDKLINSAIKLFGTYGYDAVSVRDIVKDSGVSLSAVSYHFGGKAELYKAIVIFLVDEVKQFIIKLDADNFSKLNISEMELRLKDILTDYLQLFLSENGQIRVKIFTREMTLSEEFFSYQYFMEMVENSYNFFHKILYAYYTKRGESTDKIDFIYSFLIHFMKDSHKHIEFYDCANKFENHFERLVQLVLYSRID